jgi:hypothetical protein
MGRAFPNEMTFPNLAPVCDPITARVTDDSAARPHATLGCPTPAGFTLHRTAARA